VYSGPEGVDVVVAASSPSPALSVAPAAPATGLPWYIFAFAYPSLMVMFRSSSVLNRTV